MVSTLIRPRSARPILSLHVYFFMVCPPQYLQEICTYSIQIMSIQIISSFQAVLVCEVDITETNERKTLGTMPGLSGLKLCGFPLCQRSCQSWRKQDKG